MEKNDITSRIYFDHVVMKYRAQVKLLQDHSPMASWDFFVWKCFFNELNKSMEQESLP